MCVVPRSPARGKEEMNKGPHAMGGVLLLASVSPFLLPPPFPHISNFWGTAGEQKGACTEVRS